MLNILKKYQWAFIAILIYIVGMCSYAFANFKYQSKVTYAEIDTRLLKAVNGTINILNNELGDNIRGEKAISYLEEKALAFKLQEIVDIYDVAYVYSLIDENGTLLFISSNPTPEEVRLEDEYEVTYKTAYEDVDTSLRNAFSSKEVQYGESNDQWGNFRSVYYPYENAQGDSFVVGADVYMSDVSKNLQTTITRVFLVGLFLLLLGLPLLLVALHNRNKASEARKQFIYNNHITGLKNKLSLIDDIDDKTQKNLTLVQLGNYADIVREKGQLVADAVITQFSNRLVAYEYPGFDLEVYHVQENVFGIMHRGTLPDVDIDAAGKKLFSSMVQVGYGQNGEEEIPVNVHIGAVSTEKDALVLANMALYEAVDKNLSMVRYSEERDWPQHYSSDLLNNRLLIEGIRNNNLVAFYQPIFSLTTGKIVRYEALARLMEADKLILSPNQFIPIANRSRLCHKITKIMLNNVIQKIQGTDVKVSLNVSVNDLEDVKTSNYIYSAINKANIGKQISFEILEDQKISDYQSIRKSLDKIRSLGCLIGLDDLGKHYSNFDRLLNLPLDFIKIDGGIVSQLTSSKEIISLVSEIVSFANERDISTVAEFCTSKEIYDMVLALGVDEVQGFYLGKPSADLITEDILQMSA